MLSPSKHASQFGVHRAKQVTKVNGNVGDDDVAEVIKRVDPSRNGWRDSLRLFSTSMKAIT